MSSSSSEVESTGKENISPLKEKESDNLPSCSKDRDSPEAEAKEKSPERKVRRTPPPPPTPTVRAPVRIRRCPPRQGYPRSAYRSQQAYDLSRSRMMGEPRVPPTPKRRSRSPRRCFADSTERGHEADEEDSS